MPTQAAASDRCPALALGRARDSKAGTSFDDSGGTFGAPPGAQSNERDADQCLVEVIDRVEGKAKQRNELSGPEGGAIAIEVPSTREELIRRIHELMAKGGNAAG